MTKLIKWLGLATAAVALTTGALLSGTGSAIAQPVNPARFVGTAQVDGQNVPAGTVIEARVGTAVCGVTQTFMDGGSARYVVDVAASQPDGNPACGTDGADVTFTIGGKPAIETGKWLNYQLNTVNLTYITPTPTPTPAPSATAAPASPTPKPPSTGQGTGAGGDAGVLGLTVALLGLGVVAFGVGGVAAARRSR